MREREREWNGQLNDWKWKQICQKEKANKLEREIIKSDRENERGVDVVIDKYREGLISEKENYGLGW